MCRASSTRLQGFFLPPLNAGSVQEPRCKGGVLSLRWQDPQMGWHLYPRRVSPHCPACSCIFPGSSSQGTLPLWVPVVALGALRVASNCPCAQGAPPDTKHTPGLKKLHPATAACPLQPDRDKDAGTRSLPLPPGLPPGVPEGQENGWKNGEKSNHN